DATKEDDFHKCGDNKPSVGTITVEKSGNGYMISVSVVAGTHRLRDIEVKVGGKVIATLPAKSSGTYDTTYAIKGSQTITATVTDEGYYTASGSQHFRADSDSGDSWRDRSRRGWQ